MEREPNDLMWKARLAAWIHDPAEKALVLLRDPAGHEGGTVRQLREKPGRALQESVRWPGARGWREHGCLRAVVRVEENHRLKN